MFDSETFNPTQRKTEILHENFDSLCSSLIFITIIQQELSELFSHLGPEERKIKSMQQPFTCDGPSSVGLLVFYSPSHYNNWTAPIKKEPPVEHSAQHQCHAAHYKDRWWRKQEASLDILTISLHFGLMPSGWRYCAPWGNLMTLKLPWFSYYCWIKAKVM